MTVTYGFYDSLNGDRKYNASQMSKLFEGIITDGIFESIGAAFWVSSNSNMTVNVGPGRAWFNFTWTNNDSVLVLTAQASEAALNRIDTVVLEVNLDLAVRANSIKIIKGTPATTPVAPTLSYTATLKQYPLADLYIAGNVTQILTVNITNRVGMVSTPFITAPLTSINIQALFDSMTAQNTNNNVANQATFDAWFNNLVNQLSGSQVTNLQTQIDSANLRMRNRNLLINGAMDIWQRGTSFTITAAFPYTADRWQAYRGSTIVVSKQLTSDPVNLPSLRNCLRVQRVAASSAVDQAYIGYSMESVDSYRLAGKTVTLSFYARKGTDYSAVGSTLNASIISGTGTDQSVISVHTGTVICAMAPKTLTTSWQRFSMQGAVGASINELGLYFAFTPVGTAGAADYYEITGIQLEEGSIMTSFDNRSNSEELSLCQRYFFKSYNYVDAPGTVTETPRMYFVGANPYYFTNPIFLFPVRMRATPSVTVYSPSGVLGKLRLDGGADKNVTLATLGDSGIVLYSSTAELVGMSNYTGFIVASAEL